MTNERVLFPSACGSILPLAAFALIASLSAASANDAPSDPAPAKVAATDAAPRKENPFEGTWVVEYEEWGGVRHDGDMGKHGCWFIQANVMRRRNWSSGKDSGDVFHLEVDEATPANGVNLRHIAPGAPAVAGPKAPTRYPGICELSKDGSSLKFCWDHAGVRPTRFATEKDSKMRVLALKRLPQFPGYSKPYDIDKTADTAKMRMRFGQATTDDQLAQIGNPEKVFGVYSEQKNTEYIEGTGYWGPLTAVELSDGKLVTDRGIAALAKLGRLEEVKVDRTPITGAGFAEFKAHQELRAVSIEDTKLDDAGLATLATLPQLQRLRISAPNKITATGLAQLGDFKELRHFDFDQKGAYEKDKLPFGNAEAKHLERLTNLQSLQIEPSTLTDAGFASLAKITSLEALDLDGSTATPAGIANLRALANLRSLSLTGTEVDDGCLAEIARSPLAELQLKAIKVSDEGLARLAACKSLRKVDLTASTRSTFGDAGVAQLAALNELTHLRIHCDRLTAESLNILEHLPRLERLTITSSLIKLEQKQEIQKKFPRCFINTLFE